MDSWNSVQNVIKQPIQNLQQFLTKWRSENQTVIGMLGDESSREPELGFKLVFERGV